MSNNCLFSCADSKQGLTNSKRGDSFGGPEEIILTCLLLLLFFPLHLSNVDNNWMSAKELKRCSNVAEVISKRDVFLYKWTAYRRDNAISNRASSASKRPRRHRLVSHNKTSMSFLLRSDLLSCSISKTSVFQSQWYVFLLQMHPFNLLINLIVLPNTFTGVCSLSPLKSGMLTLGCILDRSQNQQLRPTSTIYTPLAEARVSLLRFPLGC